MPDVQVPTVGRIVHYMLSAQNAEQVNRRRTSGGDIAARMKTSVPSVDGHNPSIYGWPAGAQAHIGNDAHEGDVVAMLVARVWSPTCVNGQAFLDGNDVLWVTSATEGTAPGTWCWPPRA